MWTDGTTHLLFEPIELMERLAAQSPKPRIKLVLYAGVLAPHAELRASVVNYARPAPINKPQRGLRQVLMLARVAREMSRA